MNEEIKKLLEPTEYFKEKIGIYIDAFVEYYGEESRQEIEEKFTNIFPVFYQKDPSYESSYLRDRLRYLEKKYGEKIIKKECAKYYKYIEINDKIKDKIIIDLRIKYYKVYVSQIMEFLPEQYKKQAEHFLNSNEMPLPYGLNNGCIEFVGLIHGLFDMTVYDAFTPLAEEKLRDPNVDFYEKQYIQDKRMDYFQAIGIDRGKKYQNYENLQEYYPSKEMVEKIAEIKEQVLNSYCVDYYLRLYPQCFLLKQLELLGIRYPLDKDIEKSYGIENINFVSPNFRKTKEGLQLFPGLFIDAEFDMSDKDKLIIHELNHIYELFTKREEEKKRHFIISGWDSYYMDMETGEDIPDENNKYRRLNEVIDEIIAIEIYEIWEKKGIHIFDCLNEDKKVESAYTEQFWLVKDFFQKFKKEIIASRKNGNIQIIMDAVGKENFDALADLVNEDKDYFSDEMRKQLEKDKEQKKDTELTRKYNSMLKRKHEILNNMEKHYMGYQASKSMTQDYSQHIALT